MIIKRTDFGHGYTATIHAYTDGDRDAPPWFTVDIRRPDEGLADRYEAGRDIDHALEAMATARNSGCNFDRFKAEVRLREREERGELDIY